MPAVEIVHSLRQRTDGRVVPRGAGSAPGLARCRRVATDVTFVEDHAHDDELDREYAAEYRSRPGPVARINADEARTTTLKVLPQ
jgi:hypothetical protein